MPRKKPTKPLTDAELASWEASRDIEADLLQAAREMAAGKTSVAYSPVIDARRRSGLSQSQFAALLGVSVRTLQGWEQGRRQPTGAARTLIAVALKSPQTLIDIFNDERFAFAA
ncbi:MAG: helix-turn-helix domain-containing protein [Pseudomonadota bacterium]|nr:helix-turn-helix domain-containing protein [Pseudomonadota bacterium]